MFSKVKKYKSHDELSIAAADDIFIAIRIFLLTQQKFNLGLATGASPKQTYTHLIHKLSNSSIDLSNFHTFNLDEYYPIQQSDPHSYYHQMLVEFWEPLNQGNDTFKMANGHILNGEAEDAEKESSAYEKLIENKGGIDIQILGLGVNGHIAFNEPGSEGTSKTRKIELAAETRQAHLPFFDNDLEKVPQFGLTMGIETILEANKIYLLATGESKKPIFDKLMKLSEPIPEIPASFLLKHEDVTVFTDLA